ncbi:MAG: hypothetical protein GWN87_21180, partial [Desulfuromonadales bacterium]|nr:hypothetical protein [Desulfuromonadales bacterium]
MAELLWSPSKERIDNALLTDFRHTVEREHGRTLADYDALWEWSVSDPGAFWRSVWDF